MDHRLVDGIRDLVGEDTRRQARDHLLDLEPPNAMMILTSDHPESSPLTSAE